MIVNVVNIYIYTNARNTKPESLIGNQNWYDWVWFDTPKDGQCQRGTKYVTIDFWGCMKILDKIVDDVLHLLYLLETVISWRFFRSLRCMTAGCAASRF